MRSEPRTAKKAAGAVSSSGGSADIGGRLRDTCGPPACMRSAVPPPWRTAVPPCSYAQHPAGITHLSSRMALPAPSWSGPKAAAAATATAGVTACFSRCAPVLPPRRLGCRGA
ncbi:hypothetical protein ABPG77_005367 [Micractinium sp. CCAP 211/92]